METLWLLLLAVVIGGVIGAAINVLATRLPADLPLAGLPLRPWDGRPSRWALAPFAGAIERAPLRIDWPKVGTELAATTVVAVALAAHDLTFEGWRAAIFSSVLLLILRIDWQNHLIYLVTIVPGLGIALGLSALESSDRLLSAVAAGVVAAFIFLLLFLLAFAIYRQRALGFGDVLLAGLIGAMTGLQGVGSALLLGVLLASVGGLFLIAIRVRSRRDFIPYGAYLSLGAMVVVLVGAS